MSVHVLFRDLSDYLARETGAVDWLEGLMQQAILQRASDIHLEPLGESWRVRFRIDGLLNTLGMVPDEFAAKLVIRLKIMSRLDIAERRLPQDGRFSFEDSSGVHRDCRVAICPTLHGEKLVLRLLIADPIHLDAKELGFDQEQLELFLHAIQKPQGLILVTGPTGSGKTVTLYSALNLIDAEEKNISTVEDPIEIKITGFNQVPIHPKIGLDFSTVLRAFLRQDPDVIMVGEIRDRETAKIAVKAAQTGHLVFSTLHTNSAIESITRLLNMGIPSYNIVHTINLIIAQRLLRKLCLQCRVPASYPPEFLLQTGFLEKEHQDLTLYQAKGCDACTKGYFRRQGVFECLAFTPTIVHSILTGANTQEIQLQAKRQRITSLYESALKKVKLGITSIEEITRVINL